MTDENKDNYEALSMLEHERGITAEYLIEKIKAAIIIAVKKNYEVEEDHIRVDIDPDTGRFDVALIQDIVADEDWYDEHAEIGVTEARKIRSSYEVGDRIITPLKTRDFGRIAAQTAKHVIRQGIREAERNQQLSEIQSRAHDIVQATVTRVDTEKGIVALKPSATSSPARSSPAHMISCRQPLPAWIPRRASLRWIWARAARLFCPATSRCPARCTPRARPCRSTSWTWSAPSAAPAS